MTSPFTRRALKLLKIANALKVAVDCVFDSIILGLASEEKLAELDEYYYAQNQLYQDANYLKEGLWDWEKTAIQRHFTAGSNLILLAAGSGREIPALVHMGYQVWASECHPQLRDKANRWLEEQGMEQKVITAKRNRCPNYERSADGAIIGWGAYMLIQGQEKRLFLLSELVQHLSPGSPILLSFFARNKYWNRDRLVHRLSSLIRRLCGMAPTELGDAIDDTYVHFFTPDSLEAELQAAGLELLDFQLKPYPHAVARTC